VDRNLLGRALHTLIGYSDRLTALRLLVYAAMLATIFALTRAPEREPQKTDVGRQMA
jgi:hypothetical protein